MLSNIDELFEREELSAAPDPGWPDCFNSGVFVFRPSNETHEKLLAFCSENGSFDGKTRIFMASFLFFKNSKKQSKVNILFFLTKTTVKLCRYELMPTLKTVFLECVVLTMQVCNRVCVMDYCSQKKLSDMINITGREKDVFFFSCL